ncbi:MAG: hypothetical protein PVSMB1_14680 [Gemmatimonadaceae bacterium]
MALTPGTRLGVYEVTTQIGAGGMGEVYRAKDTKLGRDVALKIVSESFTHDPERLARFRREAQVLAALNHPHIGAIYGLDDANGQQFIVLELIEGKTLADRLKRGALPFDEALANAFSAGEISHRWPQVLPGGRAVLFTALTAANFAAFDEASIQVVTLPSGNRKTLHQGGSYGRYLASGHLLYVRNGAVFAMPFDADHLEARGAPVPVLEGVAYVPTGGSAQVDASANGTLVYERGTSPRWTIQWLDASGRFEPMIGKPASYVTPRLSPDGNRLVYRLLEESRTDLWVYDSSRGTNTRLTTDAAIHNSPAWGPDGRYIAYQAEGGVFWIAADGGGKPRLLIEALNTPYPESFSNDGRWLAFSASNPRSGDLDIWTVPLTGGGDTLQAGKPAVFAHTPGNERDAAFSPDGRWLAYSSSESGAYQVYVRAFSGALAEVPGNGRFLSAVGPIRDGLVMGASCSTA